MNTDVDAFFDAAAGNAESARAARSLYTGAVESLMDVVGRAPRNTMPFSALAVHPTPYLRVFINTLLLRRLGLGQHADEIDRAWRRLYPNVTSADIPHALLATFKRAAELVIDTMVFRPYPQLAGKSVAGIIAFGLTQNFYRTLGRR